MKAIERLSAILLLCGLTACGVAGQVLSGRQALLVNKNEEALGRFQAAAESDPGYVMRSGPFREGIWTYVGRAQYSVGKFTEARRSLGRAVSLDSDDYLARIYLGLTLARSGDRSGGLHEIRIGMKGLYDWLEYLTSTAQYGRYWDPSRDIRSQIEKDLAMISGAEFDWQKLIADAEWLGKKTEDEVELARRDEQRQYRDRLGPGSGVSIGVGF
jgi:tetratricopeptide (TPR) repeat protein